MYHLELQLIHILIHIDPYPYRWIYLSYSNQTDLISTGAWLFIYLIHLLNESSTESISERQAPEW